MANVLNFSHFFFLQFPFHFLPSFVHCAHLYEKIGVAPAKIARIALVRLVQVLLGLSQVLEQGFQALPGLLIINLDQHHRLPTT